MIEFVAPLKAMLASFTNLEETVPVENFDTPPPANAASVQTARFRKVTSTDCDTFAIKMELITVETANSSDTPIKAAGAAKITHFSS